MFKFKKAMQGVSKEQGFASECCGPMDGQASAETNGCDAGCAPVTSICCGPVKSSCGSSPQGLCGETPAGKPQQPEEPDKV